MNDARKELIKEILNGLHDEIIMIWERGEEHEPDYGKQVDGLIDESLTAIQSFISQNYIPKERAEGIRKVYEEHKSDEAVIAISPKQTFLMWQAIKSFVESSC